MGTFARFSLAILRKKLHMEIQRNENNLSNSGTDNVNGRNSDHSASNRVLLPFSIQAILSAPHPLPLLSLEKFTRSNLAEDISATENAERGMMKIQLLIKGLPTKLLVGNNSPEVLELPTLMNIFERN